jgi:nitrite reductase (NO-forming)
MRAAAALILACLAALLVAAPSASGAVVPVKLKASPAQVKVAPGVKMRAWTFNGTVPGPVIRVREGDTVEVTLRNAKRKRWKGMDGSFHSIDFHAARIAPSLAFTDVAPGRKKTFSFVADKPGVYMYHCGTSPVLEHIGMGMYGMIIVDPAEGRPPAQEITLVQSEFYGKLRGGRLDPSLEAMRKRTPKFVAFNGKAERYARRPIEVPVGERVRIYLVDAGPTESSAFHVIGNIFDTVQPDGNPDNELTDVSTHLVGAGGAASFELSFPEAGTYPFVNHSFRFADAGAVGRFIAG